MHLPTNAPNEIICARCGWGWIPRIPNPKRCPGCMTKHYTAPEKKEAPAKTAKKRAA